jgi:hypothetical protein
MFGNTSEFPQFEHLPLRKGDPPYSAWSLWGADDQVGAIVCVVYSPPRHRVSLRFLNDYERVRKKENELTG